MKNGMKKVLFIKGLPDSGEVNVVIGTRGQYLVDSGGSSNLFGNLLAELKQAGYSGSMLLLAPKDLRKSLDFKQANLIVNQISESDTHKITLTKLSNYLSKTQTNPTIANNNVNVLRPRR